MLITQTLFISINLLFLNFMKKTFSKNVLVFAILAILTIPMFGLVSIVQAQPDVGINYARGIGLQGENRDPRDIAVNVIKLIMTFLGIIATVIILLGGFKWMTAAGNEDQVDQAKKLIAAGVIGLVITLSAFMIVTWVFDVTSTDLLNT
jgi:hypothetical protein